jgi:hypothetical protein
MVRMLLEFADFQGIPIRLGEAHRPYFVAKKYSKEGKGILNSKHRWSLAIDIWIIDDTGKKIIWKDVRYAVLADYWQNTLKGKAGFYFSRCDAYHFEFPEKPA